LEVFDSQFSKEKKERNFGFLLSSKTLVYNHVLLGNIQQSFFYADNKNNHAASNESKKKSLDSAATKSQKKVNENELDILSNTDLNKSSDGNNNINYNNKNNYNFINKENENENLPDTIMINDNQGFTEFSLIQPLCKNCYLNRYYDENKQKFNSVFRVVSAQEKLSDELINKVFNGRVTYESNKGEKVTAISRKGIMSSDNGSNILNNEKNLPEYEICKKTIFNNLALSYIDDNLEFDLISSKIVANLVLKNYIREDLDIFSSDF